MTDPKVPSDSRQNEECASDCACHGGNSAISRRDFIHTATLAASGLALSGMAAVAGPFRREDFQDAKLQSLVPEDKKLSPEWIRSLTERGIPTVYRDAELEKIGMPVGGICCGQLYLGGDGKLWHWDLFNQPQPGNFTDGGGPNYARPPKPLSPIEQGFALKVTVGDKIETRHLDSRGFQAKDIAFQGQYPVGHVEYKAAEFPVEVSLLAFSPFIPLNVEDSSLPVTVMRYTLKNTGAKAADVELVGWIENAV
ncbi:MAG TPA: GH116 family glycosyl-hydrolase, partial [Chthonomonadaceae bacterium]|nr:GH116 family glycosyl-hydrolase [Chthonomonadaceae bacterium]